MKNMKVDVADTTPWIDRCWSCGVEGEVGPVLCFASGDELYCKPCYQALLHKAREDMGDEDPRP